MLCFKQYCFHISGRLHLACQIICTFFKHHIIERLWTTVQQHWLLPNSCWLCLPQQHLNGVILLLLFYYHIYKAHLKYFYIPSGGAPNAWIWLCSHLESISCAEQCYLSNCYLQFFGKHTPCYVITYNSCNEQHPRVACTYHRSYSARLLATLAHTKLTHAQLRPKKQQFAVALPTP